MERMDMSTHEEAPRSFDAEALRRRYLAERDKRLRGDGESPYIEARGDFSDFVADPYVEPGFPREPGERSVDVLVVGSGFGRLPTAAALVRAGLRSFLLVRQGGAFGGPR